MANAKALTLLGLGLVFVTFQNCGGNKDESSAVSAALASTDISGLKLKAQAILSKRCESCHSATLKSGGLDVTDTKALLYYRYVVPGEPQLSLLYNMIQEGQMPPQGPLSAAEAQTISDWIMVGFDAAMTTKAPTN